MGIDTPGRQPAVSVIIPAYNSQKTLHNTLRSVVEQTCADIEIIVVDDGSEISPAFVLDHFNDNRIHLYRIERSNANVARNYGISKSKGEYIAMLDADDQWLENHLEDCLGLLRQTNADGLYGSLFLGSDNIFISDMDRSRIFYARELNEGESMTDYLLTTVCGAQTSSLVMTSAAAKDILWNPTLIDHQDYDFVVRFQKKYKLTVKKEPTVFYYRSSGRPPHFESIIRFNKMNMKDIHPGIYNRYNLNMLLEAINNSASEKIIRYFRQEATRYKEYLSYQYYISVREPDNLLKIWIEKIRYLYYVLGIRLKIKDE